MILDSRLWMKIEEKKIGMIEKREGKEDYLRRYERVVEIGMNEEEENEVRKKKKRKVEGDIKKIKIERS